MNDKEHTSDIPATGEIFIMIFVAFYKFYLKSSERVTKLFKEPRLKNGVAVNIINLKKLEVVINDNL